eukprot:3252196-Pyramimonas_sp.AAC.1
MLAESPDKFSTSIQRNMGRRKDDDVAAGDIANKVPETASCAAVTTGPIPRGRATARQGPCNGS